MARKAIDTLASSALVLAVILDQTPTEMFEKFGGVQ